MACDGAGTTIQFTTQATLNAVEVASIEGDTMEIASVEKNVLANSKTTYCPGGKRTVAPFSVEAFYAKAEATLLQAAIGVVDTITLTYPDGGIKVGTGFIQAFTSPSANDNERQMMTYSVQFDQETGPDWS